MNFVKVSENLYINLDQVQYIRFDDDDCTSLVVTQQEHPLVLEQSETLELFRYLPKPTTLLNNTNDLKD